MKRFISILVACIMVIGLFAGCGQNNDTKSVDSKTGESAAANTTKETNKTGKAQQEKITLTMFAVTGMEEFKPLVEKYPEVEPNVTIELDTMPTPEFQTMIKAKLAAQDVPDIMPTFGGVETEMYVQAGHLADISDLKAIPRYRDGALVTIDGKIYSVPYQLQFLPVFYNKKIFTENNLNIPKYWDEFLALCDKLKAAGILPFAQGNKDGWPPVLFTSGIGATVIQDKIPDWGAKRNNGSIKFATTPEWIKVFEMNYQLINNGYFSKGVVSTSNEQAIQMFVKGEAAMHLDGTWSLFDILKMKPDDFEMGSFPIPANKPGEKLAILGSIAGGMSIWSKSKYIEQAKEFLDFTLTPENNAEFNKTKGPSPLKDVVVDLHQSILEYIELAGDAKMYDWPAASQRWPVGLDAAYSKLIQEMYLKDVAKTPEQLVQALDKEWDNAVQK